MFIDKSFGKSNGFSIIEVLIGISIIILLFFVGQVNYRAFQQRQKVESAAKIFIGDLNYARQLAISGNKSIGGGVCNTLKGYAVNRSGNNSYNIVRVCDSQNCTNGTSIWTNAKFLYKEDSAIQFSSAFRVFFNTLGKGAISCSSSTCSTITPALNITIRDTGGSGIQNRVRVNCQGIAETY